ncbi:MAG: alpha/beta fold hydrolase, partial [Gemmatimonadota bacterium]
DRNYYFQMVDDARSLDLRGRFHDSRIPTLILEGRWDLAFGEWKPDVLSEEFPRARLVLLEDAGHTLFEDAPARFFRALRRFVTGLESRGARPAEDTDEVGDPANEDAARGTEPAARRDARPPTHPHTRSPEKR